MKKITLILITAFLALTLNGWGQLAAGDIAFTAFNADGDDDFAIVALVDIPSNTTIFFSDNEPNSDGSGFDDFNEGTLEWVSGGSVIAAGTIIVFTDTDASGNPNFGSSLGTLSIASFDSGMNLSGGGDALYAVEGSPDGDNISTWLAGIQNGANNQGANFDQTGLIVGSTFINYFTSSSPDGGYYSGTRVGETSFSDYLVLLGNNSNWTVDASNGENILPISSVVFTTSSGLTVAAPTFNPPAGEYPNNPQNVTISTTTAGATIYYTTDGNNPDNTSTVYTGPINIAANITLKAFAVKAGETDSQITSGDYVIVPVSIADIATLRTQTVGDNTIYQLTGEVFLTFQQTYRNQKYIQDGTAGILIDDDDANLTTAYSIGDGITGIVGKLSSYKGMLQFIPQQDAGAATSTGNTIVPVEITALEFVSNFENYEGQLVRINYLTFANVRSTFSNGEIYSVTDPDMNAMDFRTTFYSVDYIGTTIPSLPQDIVGIANERDNHFLTARDAADIIESPRPVPIGSAGIIIAVLLISAVLIIRRGKLI